MICSESEAREPLRIWIWGEDFKIRLGYPMINLGFIESEGIGNEVVL
jgi:hypothetical protein